MTEEGDSEGFSDAVKKNAGIKWKNSGRMEEWMEEEWNGMDKNKSKRVRLVTWRRREMSTKSIWSGRRWRKIMDVDHGRKEGIRWE